MTFLTLVAQALISKIGKWDIMKLKSFNTARDTITGMERAYKIGKKSLPGIHLTDGYCL